MKKLEFFKNNIDLIKNYTKVNSNMNRFNLIIKSAVDSVKDPDNGKHISELGDLTNLNSLKQIKSRMLETEEGKQIISEMPRITEKTIDFKNLCNYDKNTLGYAYYNYMIKNNFTPNERPIVKYIHDVELSYICQRYKETHDFYHVLLEKDTTLIDEVALKWFEAEHLKLSSSSLGGLFGSLTLQPKEIFFMYNKLIPGIIQVARNSRFLLGIYYEKRINQDLNQLRNELNIDLSKIPKH
jgi:ubiquinone biosynthesis protein Coq4